VRASELKRFELLSALTEEDREALAELLEEREIVDGKSAFREGRDGEGLVLLARGQLNLKSKRHGGFVGSVTAPDHLGAISLFSLGKREVTAVADGGCTVWELSRSGLSCLADDAPRAAFRLAEAAMTELAGLVRPGVDALVEHSRK
jgi:CRP-like cAMP-binding protein